MKLQQVRGTKDLFGKEIEKFNYVVELAKKVSKLYNFQEIITPIFEFSEIFERNLGDSSDIVLKEVYKFKDRSDNFLSLRPEFTAGVVRAILSNVELRDKLPLKLFSYGPVFRYDRPQKGRQRQFNQVNFEYFGNESFMADVNIIQMADNLLRELGLKNITLEVNSLGSDESRSNFENALRDYFGRYRNDLSEDSKLRLEKNVIRILDTKDENDKRVLAGAPTINSFYTNDDRVFFSNVLDKLAFLNIDFSINNLLVRGLDYYTSTVFEFTTNDLGAQNTVFAGGRYDKLVGQMGESDVPAVGCAAGVERLLLLLNDNIEENRIISIIPVSDGEIEYCLDLQKKLFKNSIPCELVADGKIKKKMSVANKMGSKFAIIVGEEEVRSGTLTVKDFDKAKEEKISLEKFLKNMNSTNEKLN
ncbi:MAG: histidine--tRNA ligase [Rickettsiales bacterium]|nr:histidine--tRNA ligase [Rickettsiales bacterium]